MFYEQFVHMVLNAHAVLAYSGYQKNVNINVAITPRGNLTLRPLSGIHCNSILDFNILYMKIIGNLYMAILNTRKLQAQFMKLVNF